MSYHATNGWITDGISKLTGMVSEIEAKAAAQAAQNEGDCTPSEYEEDPEWCDLLARKNREFAAAAAEGITPAQWYKKQGTTPAGKPIPPPDKIMGVDKDMLKWGAAAAVVGFLLLRKK